MKNKSFFYHLENKTNKVLKVSIPMLEKNSPKITLKASCEMLVITRNIKTQSTRIVNIR